MSLKTSVKFLAKFDLGSAVDQVSGESLSVVGLGSADVESSGGYRMTRDQYLLLTGISASVTNAFSLGFFLTSSNEGRIPNGSSTLPAKVCVLDFGVGSGSGSSFVMSQKTLIIHEECEADGLNNKMRFLLHNSGGNIVYQALTPTYEAGKKHHFWVAYDGDATTFTIFIDGDEITSTTSGAVPSLVGLSTAAFAVNRYAFNDPLLITGDSLISDVVLFNTVEDSQVFVQSAINNSVDNVVDNDFSSVVEQDFGIYFSDPSPVRTNSAINDGSSIITARTDGVLSEGARLLWESRRDFSDPNEISLLNTVSGAATQESRLLKLTNMVQL